MANRFYSLGVEAFLTGAINALSDTLKVDLVSSASYTPNTATDQYHSTITSSGGIIAAGVTLTSVTGSAGTLSAANTVWSSVSGSAAAYIVLWKSTGTDGTSPLIVLYDTATGLPVTPNGGNITAAWASGQLFTLRESLADRERARLAERLRRRGEELMRHLGIGRPRPRLIGDPRPQIVGMPPLVLG
jgi:hypothetical protein